MHRTVQTALSAAMLLASLAAVAAKPVYKIELVPTQNDMRPLFPEKISNEGVVFGRARDVENRRQLSRPGGRTATPTASTTWAM